MYTAKEVLREIPCLHDIFFQFRLEDADVNVQRMDKAFLHRSPYRVEFGYGVVEQSFLLLDGKGEHVRFAHPKHPERSRDRKGGHTCFIHSKRPGEGLLRPCEGLGKSLFAEIEGWEEIRYGMSIHEISIWWEDATEEKEVTVTIYKIPENFSILEWISLLTAQDLSQSLKEIDSR